MLGRRGGRSSVPHAQRVDGFRGRAGRTDSDQLVNLSPLRPCERVAREPDGMSLAGRRPHRLIGG